MSRSSGVRATRRSPTWLLPGWSSPTTPRLVAVAFGLLLTGAYVSVFYHVADVAGGSQRLLATVLGALALATVVSLVTSTRGSVAVGGLLLVAGVAAYLSTVPELHDDLLTVAFAMRWAEYLTGLSVLEFRRAGTWAVAVAPGPVFLSWALLLRRRYDAAALAGGLMLGFFALTGDAGPTTTLVGMASALGLLGAGTVDLESGALGDVARLGFLLALAVVAARVLRLVPGDGAVRMDGAGGGSGGSGDDAFESPFEGDLDNADERAHIHESISLSPRVLFTVDADEVAYLRVGAYDRYTGSDWIRTGGTSAYGDPLEPPAGASRRVEQAVEAEAEVGTLPAAWKPVSIRGIPPERIEVTDLEGLVPDGTLAATETYRVTSRVPEGTRERLREAGTEYPRAVRERYLQFPESTPGRVGALAADVAGDAETPYDAAVAIQQWLQSEKDYDLEVDRPDGDVVDVFLHSMGRGYCVYFASAMVVMLRTIDVPARYVLGFSPGQRVDPTRWVVRGLDSHAWVEVYFPDTGWVQFDPTPSTGRRMVRSLYTSQARADGVAGVDTNESRAAYVNESSGNFEEFARARALGENRTTATAGEPGGNASEAGSTPDGSPADPADPGDPQRVDPTSAAVDAVGEWAGDRDRLSVLAGGVGLALGLHWLGAFDRASRGVKLRWQRPTDSPRRDVERAYERMEILLARRFRPREPTETRRGYFRRAAAAVDVGDAGRVLDLSERASYGGDVDRAEADEAIRIVDGLVEGDR